MRTLSRGLLTLAALTLLLAGCTVATDSAAQNTALNKAAAHEIYNPKNDVEYKNYNQRQIIADDPTTILWCTTSFNNPSSPMFTVPVVGKLTSGNKRPYATSISDNTKDYRYTPELPGPDGMFGASGEYRYGFTPGGQYVDLYNLKTFCTTEPTVWQRQSTVIVLATDPTLLAAQKIAQSQIAAGNPAAGLKTLEDAIKSLEKK